MRRDIGMHRYPPEQGGLLYYESTMGAYLNHACDSSRDFSALASLWRRAIPGRADS